MRCTTPSAAARFPPASSAAAICSSARSAGPIYWGPSWAARWRRSFTTASTTRFCAWATPRRCCRRTARGCPAAQPSTLAHLHGGLREGHLSVLAGGRQGSVCRRRAARAARRAGVLPAHAAHQPARPARDRDLSPPHRPGPGGIRRGAARCRRCRAGHARAGVYVGDWNGRVYALSAASGATRWTFQAGDKIKDAVAYDGGRVYFGSYDHHVYALNARTGKLVWKATAQQRLGNRGTFYSTPAVAYDRVYIGSTDGKVYSFGATSGKLRWSHGTGGYVYSSPAVFPAARLCRLVHRRPFYCFDAATGDVRWKYRTNGPISGSPIVINGVVYVSSLKGRTYGLDPPTGKLLWSFRRRRGTCAVVSDSQAALPRRLRTDLRARATAAAGRLSRRNESSDATRSRRRARRRPAPPLGLDHPPLVAAARRPGGGDHSSAT